jgi:hypothetical protein
MLDDGLRQVGGNLVERAFSSLHSALWKLGAEMRRPTGSEAARSPVG